MRVSPLYYATVLAVAICCALSCTTDAEAVRVSTRPTGDAAPTLAAPDEPELQSPPVTVASSRRLIEAALAPCRKAIDRSAESAIRASSLVGCFRPAPDDVNGAHLPLLELRPELFTDRFGYGKDEVCLVKSGETLVETPCPLRGERGVYLLRYSGAQPPFTNMWTALWFLSKDSIAVHWGGGYEGVQMCLRLDETGLVGHYATTKDYPDIEALVPVRYVRTPCEGSVDRGAGDR